MSDTERPPEPNGLRGPRNRTHLNDSSSIANRKGRNASRRSGLYALLPIEIVDLGLGLDSLKVALIYATHAGRDRLAWPSAPTVAVELRWHSAELPLDCALHVPALAPREREEAMAP